MFAFLFFEGKLLIHYINMTTDNSQRTTDFGYAGVG